MVTETGSSAGTAPSDLAYGPPTPAVQRFLLELRRIPLSSWMQIALSAPVDPDDRALESEELRMARRRLREAMDAMPLALRRAKRRVQDTVDATAGFTPRSVNASMKRVAVTAALALIARPYLSERDFTTLYAPFAEFIPTEPAARRSVGADLEIEIRRSSPED